ncbi:calcium binding EGF domain-containing protein [Aphelenchoides avenae]|nr:calcium binding EGF domain-containing protein [Aphelenchus avenae]
MRARRPFKCTYRIFAHPSQAIRLKFTYIGLKTDVTTCSYRLDEHKDIEDYIELSGGHASNENLNKRYVCARYPFVSGTGEVVTSGSRTLAITYSTSGSPNNTGFLFEYEIFDVGCGDVYVGESGVITSPNYPEKYLSHMFCVYQLNVPPEKGIRLTFDVFDVENVANRVDCGFDSVRVFKWFVDEEHHGDLLGRILRHSEATGAVVDRRTPCCSAVDVSDDCDRTFTAPSGVISVDPSTIQHATKCEYQIVVITNHASASDQSREHLCSLQRYDTIMIRNGGSELSPGFPGLYRDSEVCDDYPIKQLQTHGNRAFIRFKTTDVRGVYFTVAYEQLESSCGGHIHGHNGAISSPQYPHEDSRTLSCEWHVTVAPGNKVRLQFTQIDDLDSADSDGLCWPFARNHIDVLEDSDNLLKRYCRKENAPSPIEAEGNQLTVRYNQHGGSHHGPLYGFLAQFEAVCTGVTLTGFHGTLQSPGYPASMMDPRTCHWQIRTSPGSRIRIVFHTFTLVDDYRRASNVGCFHNYFEVDSAQVKKVSAIEEDIAVENSTRTKFCSRVAQPTEIETASNVLDITFQSGNQPANHFWLTWSTIGCGGIVTRNESALVAKATDFTQPAVETFRECDWVIRAPPGLVVRVLVEEAMMVHFLQNPCDRSRAGNFSGVQFFAGTSNATGVPLATKCGIVRNESVTAYGNELFVRLSVVAPYTLTNNGTILKATVFFEKPSIGTGCGGDISLQRTTSLTIFSPNYPKPYPRAVECVWQLRAPEGYVIQYMVTQFTTPNQHAKRLPFGIYRPDRYTKITCSTSLSYTEGSISFYDGTYNESDNSVYGKGLLERFCLDTKEPKIVHSNRNMSFISFLGAPYDPVLPSGDTHESEPVGFTLVATPRCGGQLVASSETKVLVLGKQDSAETHENCTYEIIRHETGGKFAVRLH